jgi:hypothetical protein
MLLVDGRSRRQGLDGANVMRENFSLIVMCVFLILSLAFLAQQFSLYR